MPGYFRIAYCVDTPVIERSLPGFQRVIRALGVLTAARTASRDEQEGRKNAVAVRTIAAPETTSR